MQKTTIVAGGAEAHLHSVTNAQVEEFVSRQSASAEEAARQEVRIG